MANVSHCFIPDTETVFKIVKVIDRNSDGTFTVVDAERPDTRPQRIKQNDCIEIHSIEELQNPPTDLIKLQNVHQATILHTLRSRFSKDFIYTSIGPILVALNPFKWIGGIYENDVKDNYRDKIWNLSDNPHVFAMAHDAFSDLQYGQNQSMIIRYLFTPHLHYFTLLCLPAIPAANRVPARQRLLNNV